MKKKTKRLALRRETLTNLSEVSGGGITSWSCPTTGSCAVSLAFTNCHVCPTWTALKTTCFTCGSGGGASPPVLIQQ